MVGLMTLQYDQLGFTENDDDPMLKKYHRINILTMACSVGHPDCIEQAKSRFADWMNKTNPDSDNP